MAEDDAVLEMFADEDRAGSLIKSLISAQPLEAAWTKIGRRLQSVEATLVMVQGTLDRLPQDYVTRGDYRETVETKHATMLVEQGTVLRRVDELSSRLSSTVFDEHSPKLKSCLTRLQVQEEWQEKVQRVVSEVEKRGERLESEVMQKLQASTDEVSQHIGEADRETAQLRRTVQERLDGMTHELEALEKRAADFTLAELQRSTKELLRMDDAEDGEREGEAMTPQQKMAALIRKGTAQLRLDINAARQRLSGLEDDLGKQKDDLTKQIRSAEKSALDGHVKVKQSIQEVSDEVRTCAKKTAMQTVEGTLAAAIADGDQNHQALKKTMVLKLNEFLDHFGKLQETIDDHEHCLTHHAEELENRSTKYDVLVCQKQIDKCVRKEEFSREVSEIKQVLDWQSGKIESFGLMTAANPGGMKPRVRRSSHASLKPRMQSRSASVRDFSETSSPVAGDPGTPERRGSRVSKQASQRSLGGIAEIDVTPQGTGMITGIPEGIDEQPISPYDTSSEEESSSEEDPNASGGHLFSNNAVFRKQLEALSMGLLGLAHLLLLQPKLGTSRNARLAEEKELLDELLSLRHWITNRIAPAGWDPGKLLTVALRCTHLPHHEVLKPMPQLSLKGLMHHAADGDGGKSRHGELSQSASARSEFSKSFQQEASPKAPLSARGAGDPKYATLPPLSRLVAAS